MNDWIVANINNPNFDISDFKNIADMTYDNTQLLPASVYLNNQKIRDNELFKDQDGNFNSETFMKFYNYQAHKFQEFYQDSYIDTYEYNMWDTRRTKDSKVKNPNFHFLKAGHPDNAGFSQIANVPIVTVFNPDRTAIGVEGVNVRSERSKSISELAQSSAIFDTKSGEFLDKTVNDNALFGNDGLFKNIYNYFSSLGDDPLVIAQYDQDVYDDNGKLLHQKGEFKYNADGTYYTETLNNRSPIGKQFISALDYITIDGAASNKYDFFDSDGVDKSASGIIAKNLVSMAPLLIGGPVAWIYGGLFVAKELAKAMPMLADIVTLFGNDVDSPFLNTIAGYGNKFSGSTSEYSRNNLFTLENIGNLVSDVALQWGQQKAILNTITRLTGGSDKVLSTATTKAAKFYADQAQKNFINGLTGKTALDDVFKYVGTNKIDDVGNLINSGKWMNTPLGVAALDKYVTPAKAIIQNRYNIGKNLALAYMSIISNTDVYESIIHNGGTKKEAAAIALGSIVGMFSVNKMLGLGEAFYDDASSANRRLFRESARKSADDIHKELLKTGTVITTKDPKTVLSYIKGGFQAGINTVKNYRGALKEHSVGFWGKALGEGLEEVSEELVSDVSRSLGELAGHLGVASKTDYGAWENMAARYSMSLLGGAIGGGMFYGIEAFQKAGNSSSQKELDQSLIYVLRNHKKEELLRQLEKDYNSGYEFASKTLSIDTDGEGNFITTDKEHKSQNQYVYERLVESIHQIDQIIKHNQMDLSDSELFDQMVMSEARFLALKDFLQDASYVTGYQQEYNNLIEEIKNLSLARQTYNKDHLTEKEQREAKALDEKLLDAQKRRDDFANGKNSLYYTEKMLFAIDTGLNQPFISMNLNQWVRHNYGKDINDLTESERESIQPGYEAYKKLNQKDNLTKAFDIYKGMQQQIMPTIEALDETEILEWHKIAQELSKTSPLSQLKNYNSKLDSESEEGFKNRDTQLEGESDEDFENRKAARIQAIHDYNNENLQKMYETFIQGRGFIDSHSFRIILSHLIARKQDIKQNAISDRLFGNILQKGVEGAIYDFDKDIKIKQSIETALKNLKYDGSNKAEILAEVEKILNDNYKKVIGAYYIDEQALFESADFAGINTYQELFNMMLNDPNSEILAEFIGQLDEDQQEHIKNLYNRYLEYKSKIDIINQQLTNGDITPEESENLIKILQEDLPILLESQIGMSYDNINQAITEHIEQQGKAILQYLEKDLIDAIIHDPWINIFNEFENKLKTDANPVVQVIKMVRQNFEESKNLENVLQDIYKQWNEIENISDFELNDAQEKSLLEINELLDYAKAYIYGASTTSAFNQPIGHNKSLNEYVQHHKKAFEDAETLPELREDVANILLYEIQKYQKEAQYWIKKSSQNRINKTEKLKNAHNAITKSRMDFYRANSNLTLSDSTNLLEGIDSLDQTDNLKNLVARDNLLYQNFQKALAKGWTKEAILEELYKKITNINNINEQIVSSLNENLKYPQYTEYDKFQMLTSILAVDDIDFYKRQKAFLETAPKTKDGDVIVPLTPQEYAQRIIDAGLRNPDFINTALEIVQKNSSDKLPILYNTSIITGKGGVGKTQVGIKASVHGIDNSKIWVSGPTDDQVNNLQDILKGSKGYSIDQLMEIITPEYKSLMEQLNKDSKIDPKYKYAKSRKLNRSNNVVVDIADNFPINTTMKKEELPEVIVIDETTLVPAAVLQVLGKWAKSTGVKIILAGDENQGSFTGVGKSIDRETVLAWRTSRLDISLRDANLQKAKNLQAVENLLDELRTSTHITESRAQQLYDVDIPKINFKYYLDEKELNGEIITNTVTNDLLRVLQGSKVGYVGNASDALYKELQSKGINVVLYSEQGVQGKEFDYTIINSTWTAPNKDTSGYEGYKFLQKLYTMMSRSRKGTIFIDNGLSNIISNSKDTVQAHAPSLKEAAKVFNKFKMNEYNSLELDSYTTQEEPEKVEGSTEEDSEGSSEESSEKGSEGNPEEDSGNDAQETEKILSKEEKEKSEEKEKRREENRKEQNQIINDFFSSAMPIRMYSNVHLLGVKSYKNDEGKYVWDNSEDSKQDVGIFLRPGITIIEDEAKDDIVKELLDIKSFIIFPNNKELYSKLSVRTRSLFNEQSFNNIQYYLQVKDDDSLIGLTNLDSDKIKIEGKVFSIVVAIKGNDGVEYKLTLGTLANPDTWKANKDNITSAIREQLKNNPNPELEQYVDNFDDIVENYRQQLQIKAKENKYYPIAPPKFTGMTELIFKDSEGKRLEIRRLEDPDTKATPWQKANKYAITSRIVEVTKEVPGTNLKLGTVVRYGTTNRLLNSEDLESLYWAQRDTEGATPEVRMEVLDTLGVSFRSLFSKDYMALYNLNIKGNVFTFPFDLEPTAIRMYLSIWNFRANLNNFLLRLEEWKEINNISDVDSIAKADTELYNKFREEKGTYLPDAEYRKWAEDKASTDIKKLWKFNDDLANSVRQFRLGYADNGVYVRTLTNINPKDNAFYKDIENPRGVYITHNMAIQYQKVLDKMFSVFLDKVIPQPSEKITTHISLSDKSKKYNTWYTGIKKNRVLNLNLQSLDDTNAVQSVQIAVAPGEALKAIPVLLVEMAKYINYYSNWDAFESAYTGSEEHEGRFHLKIGEEDIPYLEIAEAWDGGIWKSYESADIIPGVRDFTNSKGITTTMDFRMNDLWDIMFHGFIVGSGNDFLSKTKNRATDAYYKDGIKADPIMYTPEKNNKGLGVVATHKALFGSDVNYGFPIAYVSLDEYIQPTEEAITITKEHAEASINETINVIEKTWQDIINGISSKSKSSGIIGDESNIQNLQLLGFAATLGLIKPLKTYRRINGIESLNIDEYLKVTKELMDKNIHTPKELLKALKDKINNNATLDSLASDFNAILKKNGLPELSAKVLSRIKTVDDLITVVNGRLKSYYTDFFDKGFIKSIFDIIEKVEIKDGTIIKHKFSEYKDFPLENEVAEQKRVDNAVILILNTGQIVTIQYIGGELRIVRNNTSKIETNTSESSAITFQNLIDHILNIENWGVLDNSKEPPITFKDAINIIFDADYTYDEFKKAVDGIFKEIVGVNLQLPCDNKDTVQLIINRVAKIINEDDFEGSNKLIAGKFKNAIYKLNEQYCKL